MIPGKLSEVFTLLCSLVRKSGTAKPEGAIPHPKKYLCQPYGLVIILKGQRPTATALSCPVEYDSRYLGDPHYGIEKPSEKQLSDFLMRCIDMRNDRGGAWCERGR